MWCQYVVPCWSLSEKQTLRSTSVQIGDTWSLRQHSTTRHLTENLCQSWSSLKQKMLIFCVQTNWVCPSETQRFCKNDCLESSHSVKHVTRVESPCYSTWLESESPKIVTRVKSLARVTLSLISSNEKYKKRLEGSRKLRNNNAGSHTYIDACWLSSIWLSPLCASQNMWLETAHHATRCIR